MTTPQVPYSCNRRYHQFNEDKTRDQHYKESNGRWTDCTHPRCPLRYNTQTIPSNIPIPEGLKPTNSRQERRIAVSYGQSPVIERHPAPAGSSSTLSSPRVFSGSISPRVSLQPILEPEQDEEPESSTTREPEQERTTGAELPRSPKPETVRPPRDPSPDSSKSEHEDPVSNKPSDTPIRRAYPSFMSGTSTVPAGTSISTAHGYAFSPAYSGSTSGGYMGGSAYTVQPTSTTAPVATATSGGVVSQTSGGGSSSNIGGQSSTGGTGGPAPGPPNPGPPTPPPGGGGGQGPNPPGPPGPPGPNPPVPPGNPPILPPPIPVAPGGKGKIKDPEVFNGDRSKTRSFLNQLFLLFTARPHDFVNDYTKVATALSFMEGENINYWKDTAIQRAEEEVQPGVPRGFDTWAVFKQNFQTAFAPIDEVDDSMVQLTTIQLRDYTSVDEFNARFMDLALKGNIRDPIAQLALYRQALPEYLLRKISMSYPAPTNIAEWMTRTKELDHNYQLTEKIVANRRSRRTKTSKTKKTVRVVDVDEDTLNINKLSVKERQELQNKGLCFRCRKPGHIPRDCLLPPYVSPSHQGLRSTS